MLEGVKYLFEGQNLASLAIANPPDMAVCPAPYLLEHLVSFEDVLLYLLGHGL